MPKILRSVGVFLLLWCSLARADKLDEFVQGIIETRHIAGLSLAVIKDSKIVKTAAYGMVDKETKTPVTPTPFLKGGSIRNPVSTLGGLLWFEEKKFPPKCSTPSVE